MNVVIPTADIKLIRASPAVTSDIDSIGITCAGRTQRPCQTSNHQYRVVSAGEGRSAGVWERGEAGRLRVEG